MWFDNWSDVGRVVAVGCASYALLVVSIRVSGKRTLAQLNAFDFVVTVALGSTLATILLSSDVSFVEGATAIVLLLSLQVLVALCSVTSARVRRVLTAKPAVLLWRGRMDETALRRHRVSRADVEQAVRQSGSGELSAIGAVVLESNGRISVIEMDKLGSASSLGGVSRSRGTGSDAPQGSA
ncbi:DUF421 domain-containing protein [Microbacterium insulae]|uniref:DUF421 domain-containing protein n=1 Tax=Microbacterium insulae TaxID=483014 RepID=A0ABW3AI97_9MICO